MQKFLDHFTPKMRKSDKISYFCKSDLKFIKLKINNLYIKDLKKNAPFSLMNFYDKANQMTKRGNFGHIIDNLAHSLPFVGSYLNY